MSYTDNVTPTEQASSTSIILNGGELSVRRAAVIHPWSGCSLGPHEELCPADCVKPKGAAQAPP